MKKILISILCLVTCILTTSCSPQKNVDFDISDSQNLRSENTEQQNGTADPPLMISFDSADEIKEFVTAVFGTEEQYEAFTETHPDADTLKQLNFAENIASNIMQIKLPRENNVNVEDFSAVLYVEPTFLDIVYSFDEIRYRFSYDFSSSESDSYEGTPVQENIPIASTAIDLYQNDNSLYGTVKIGTTPVDITVHTDNPNNINFDCFTFDLISDFPNPPKKIPANKPVIKQDSRILGTEMQTKLNALKKTGEIDEKTDVLLVYRVHVLDVFQNSTNITEAFAHKKAGTGDGEDGTEGPCIEPCYVPVLNNAAVNCDALQDSEDQLIDGIPVWQYSQLPKKILKALTDDKIIKTVSEDINVNQIYLLAGKMESFTNYGNAVYYETDRGDYVYFVIDCYRDREEFIATEYRDCLLKAEDFSEFLETLEANLNAGGGRFPATPGLDISKYDPNSQNFYLKTGA